VVNHPLAGGQRINLCGKNRQFLLAKKPYSSFKPAFREHITL